MHLSAMTLAGVLAAVPTALEELRDQAAILYFFESQPEVAQFEILSVACGSIACEIRWLAFGEDPTGKRARDITALLARYDHRDLSNSLVLDGLTAAYQKDQTIYTVRLKRE